MSVWMLDVAPEYPSSTFVGFENISSITAASSSKLSFYYSSKIPEPRNATVLQTSSTFTGLPFPDKTFDLIYHKLAITIFTQTFKHVKSNDIGIYDNQEAMVIGPISQ